MQDSLNQLTTDPSYMEYAYITYDDIRHLPNLTDSLNETLIAIRAPPGTNLEVPNPESLPSDEKERYQILLHSNVGEILVYMISNEKYSGNNILSNNPPKTSQDVVDEIKNNHINDTVIKQENVTSLFSTG